jgi:teichoic acid transport system permease protein
MIQVLSILKEQLKNVHLIMRLSSFEMKSKYQMHYLGILWQFFNPAIQIFIYWLIFGLGIRNGHPVGDVPFFAWLIAGLIPWFFISPSIIQGSNSVYSKVNLVAKMNFPVSVLPSIVIVSNVVQLIVMLGVLGVVLFIYQLNPGMYLLQLPYYLAAMLLFLFAFTTLCSTISTIVRDFQVILQSLMRMMLYLTPILWVPGQLPELLDTILKLNPIYYLINGFRMTFLGEGWFFDDLEYTLYFWVATLSLLFIGATVQKKFKNRFIDYI